MGEQLTEFGVGYNLRLGGEILLTEDISIAGIVSWDTVTMFSYFNIAYGSDSPELKLASFSIQANFYLF
jgi:hypothetical protein